MTEYTKTPWGLWSKEGFTKTGKALHSICANGRIPTPNGELDVCGEEGWHFCVAQVRGTDTEHAHANAAFIVKAVNAHEANEAKIAALVEALKLARARIEFLGLVCTNHKHFDANFADFFPRIDAALAIAEPTAAVTATDGDAHD